MSNLSYICLDTETGGISIDTSLLTVYFGVFNSNFDLVDELDLKFRPDDGIFKVTPQGMAVNKIDLSDLEANGITYKAAKTVLYEFLKRNFEASGEKLVPIAHNGIFDINRVKRDLISEGSWEQFVSYRILDTAPIARFLMLSGKLDVESVSLSYLVDYFGIQVEGNKHEARYDALATVKVLQRFLELVK